MLNTYYTLPKELEPVLDAVVDYLKNATYSEKLAEATEKLGQGFMGIGFEKSPYSQDIRISFNSKFCHMISSPELFSIHTTVLNEKAPLVEKFLKIAAVWGFHVDKDAREPPLLNKPIESLTGKSNMYPFPAKISIMHINNTVHFNVFDTGPIPVHQIQLLTDTIKYEANLATKKANYVLSKKKDVLDVIGIARNTLTSIKGPPSDIDITFNNQDNACVIPLQFAYLTTRLIETIGKNETTTLLINFARGLENAGNTFEEIINITEDIKKQIISHGGEEFFPDKENTLHYLLLIPTAEWAIGESRITVLGTFPQAVNNKIVLKPKINPHPFSLFSIVAAKENLLNFIKNMLASKEKQIKELEKYINYITPSLKKYTIDVRTFFDELETLANIIENTTPPQDVEQP